MSLFISQTQVSFETPSTIIHDRKFDTALRSSQIQAVNSRLKNNKLRFDDRLIFRSNFYNEDIPYTSSTTCYPRLWSTIVKGTYPMLIEKPKERPAARIANLIKDNIMFQTNFMNKSNFLPNRRTLIDARNQFLDKTKVPIVVQRLLDFATWMSSIINLSHKMYATFNINDMDDETKIIEILKVNHATHPKIPLTFVWSHQLVYIIHDQQRYLLPRPYMLLIHNKLCDVISVLMLATYNEGNQLPVDAYDTTLTFLQCLCRLSLRYKEKYHAIAKTLEALVVGETLMEVDTWRNTHFIETLMEAVYEETGFEYQGSELQLLLQDVDIPFRHELGCLSKMMGHPLVDMFEGTKSLYEKTHEQYSLNYKRVLDCECYIKENYIRNSIVKNRQWPPHELDLNTVHPAIRFASLMNQDPNSIPIVQKYGRITISDYHAVKLLPNMKFSKLENVIPYLKDKTISVCRSKVFQGYLDDLDVREQKRADGEDYRPKWQDTRLLLAYLLHPKAVLDHVSYIDKYNDSDTLDDLLDYLVIRIVPKEKELKVNYRGFGCKTYEDRLRALAQEKNAMKYLDEYSDEQAMTLGELELARRLDAFRRLERAYTRHYVVKVTVDSSSWNNHFRSETVDELMKNTLDAVHGTKIFQKTHLAFQKTLMYVPDCEGVYHWEGQAGGIEGLNQDTWVVTYIAQIKCALEEFPGLRYHILCKGDDFRLAIMIPKHTVAPQDVGKHKDTIVTTISNIAKELGHVIKIQESYGSETYFNFSKQASVRTLELPQTYRKCQKCYGANNAMLATMDDYIGSTFSNAHSTCKAGVNIVGCYMLALFWTYYYCIDDPNYKKLSDDELVALSLVPSLFGGFPIIYLHNMFVRAEADLMTPFLDMYNFAQHLYPMYAEVFTNFISVSLVVPESKVGLFKDPYTVPINRPILPTAYLRKRLMPILASSAKNETIRELIRAAKSTEQASLVEALNTAVPCHAKMLSNLYACLPVALLEEVLRKFESSRSIHEFFILRRGKRYASAVLKNTIVKERKLQAWRIKRIRNVSLGCRDMTWCYSRCPMEFADRIREQAWGVPIEGITMPPLSHTLHFTTQFLGAHIDWDMQNHFTYTISYDGKYLTPDRRYHYLEGQFRPFIGYTTRTGTLEPKIHFIEKDMLLTKIKNILDIVSWSSVRAEDDMGRPYTSNVRQFVESLLRLYTSEPLSSFTPFAGNRKSGTYTHHGRAPGFRESIIPNTLCNNYLKFKGDTNTHIALTQSNDKHYYINFLHVYCYSAMIAFQETEYAHHITTPPNIWTVTTECQYCLRPIVEKPVMINMSLVDIDCGNPLAGTIIDKTAEAILKESLQMASHLEYNVHGDAAEISVPLATQGLVKELMEVSIRQVQRIQDRYTQHAMTSEQRHILSQFQPQNSHRDLSLTEFKMVPINDLLVPLTDMVALMYIDRLYFENLSSSLIECMSIPPMELPWHSVVIFLFRAGRLSEVLHHLATLTQNPYLIQSEVPETLTPYFGYLCCALFITRIKDIHSVVVLTNYNINDNTFFIKRDISVILWSAINKLINGDNDLEFHDDLGREDNLSDHDIRCLRAHIFAIMIPYIRVRDNFLQDVRNGPVPMLDIVLIDHDQYDNDVEVHFDDNNFPLHFRNKYTNYIEEQYENAVPYRLVSDVAFFDDGNRLDIVMTTLESLQIQVRLTTLTACILAVRNTAEQERGVKFIPPLPTQILRYIIPGDDHRSVCTYPSVGRIEPTIATCEVLGQTDFPERNDIHPGSNLSQSNTYRLYGYTNSSYSHAYHFFKDHIVSRIKGMKVVCLGDGYGGWTEYTLKYFPDSIALYNTRPIERALETRPEPVIANNDLRHRVIYEHLNAGVWDLADRNTLEYYSHIFPLSHVVVSDAETSKNTPGLHVPILYNVVNYYLFTRSEFSLLILKTYTWLAVDNIKLIGLLSFRCDKVWCYQPPSMKDHNVFYICASGIRNRNILYFENDLNELLCYATISKVYILYVNKLYDKLRSITTNPHHVRLSYTRHGPASRLEMLAQPIYWINMCAQHIGVIYQTRTFTAEYTFYPLHQKISVILDLLPYEEKANVYKNQLRGLNIERNIRRDDNTQQHRIALIGKWLRLYGFYVGLQILQDDLREHNDEVSRNIIPIRFREFLGNLAVRDFNPNHRYENLYQYGCYADEARQVRLPYWENYMFGMSIAVSALAFVYDIHRRRAGEQARQRQVIQ